MFLIQSIHFFSQYILSPLATTCCLCIDIITIWFGFKIFARKKAKCGDSHFAFKKVYYFIISNDCKKKDQLLTASFSAFPALNEGSLHAAIVIVSPV